MDMCAGVSRRTRVLQREREPDLRRKHAEELVERLLQRAVCLPAADLALLRAVYRDGHSTVELARVLGSEPRHLRRRLRQVAARVLSPEFIYVLRHRDSWPPERSRVATACILHGKTFRQAARELKRSVYTVRMQYREVMAAMEGEERATRRSHVSCEDGRGQETRPARF
jgi:DNA-binding NarL/FixJ family response regulator